MKISKRIRNEEARMYFGSEIRRIICYPYPMYHSIIGSVTRYKRFSRDAVDYKFKSLIYEKN